MSGASSGNCAASNAGPSHSVDSPSSVMRSTSWSRIDAARSPDGDGNGNTVGHDDCSFSARRGRDGQGARPDFEGSEKIGSGGCRSPKEIGRAHVYTPVTNAPPVCRLQLE